MRRGSLSLTCLILLTACGDDDGTGPDASSPPTDGQVSPDGSLPGPDAVTPPPDGAAPGPDAAVDPARTCQPACTEAADCALGSVAYDADNYACTGGGCVYLGCNGDGECQALGAYVCRQPAGYTLPLCVSPCDVPADCDQGSSAYDADNYACTDGVCEYVGCRSTAECQTLGDYVCATPTGSSLPLCLKPCDVPADCDQGSLPFDADNYACTGGVCEYRGCNGDGECEALGDYVCSESTAP